MMTLTLRVLCVACALASAIAAQRGGGEYRGPSRLSPAVGPEHDAHKIAAWRRDAEQTEGTLGEEALGLRRPERWEFWWELHRERFLPRPRPALAGDSETRRLIAGALRSTLFRAEDPSIREACLIALGKGLVGKRAAVDAPAITDALQGSDASSRAAAALALGIGGYAAAVERLQACAKDDEDTRARAFACYALGLIAERSQRASERRAIGNAMLKAVQRKSSPEDVRIAALIAAGMCEPIAEDNGRALAFSLWKAGEALLRRSPDRLLTAHVASTMSGWPLQAGGRQVASAFAKYAIGKLEAPSPPKGLAWARDASSAVALGRIEAGIEAGAKEIDIDQLIEFCIKSNANLQTRAFAMMAAAERGGGAARDVLLDRVRSETDDTALAWSALALGVSANLRSRQAARDRIAGLALLARFKRCDSEEALAALGLALGLVGDPTASEALLSTLKAKTESDGLVGYLCIALALINEPRAQAPIARLIKNSDLRPARLRQAVRAAGILSSIDSKQLVALLNNADLSSATLGQVVHTIGEQRDIEIVPRLIEILSDHESLRVRSFAASALGAIVDERAQHWSNGIVVGLNYRAAVPTLSDGANGVLDQL